MIGLLEIGNDSFFENFNDIAGAYSLRKIMRDAVLGIQIRNSSNAVTEVILPENGSIDLNSEVTFGGTLGEFVGSGDAYIIKWYDPAKYGINTENTAAGSQPKLIIGGVLQTKNEKAAINFVDIMKLTGAANPAFDSGKSFTVFAVAANKTTKDARPTVFTTSSTASRLHIVKHPSATSSLGIHINNGTTGYGAFSSQDLANTDPALITAIVDGTTKTMSLFINGVAGDQNVPYTGDFANTLFNIGYWGTNSFFYFDGQIQEIIIFENKKDADRERIEAEIMEFYSISKPVTPPPPPPVEFPTEGLVSVYELDATSGAVVDSYGGNNGTNSGATRGVVGKLGNAFSFNGSSHVNLGNPTPFKLSEGTIACWIKTGNAGTGFRGIVVKQFAYGIFLNNNELVTYSWEDPVGIKATGITINDNEWHHIVLNFGRGTNGTEIYLDAVLILTTTIGAVRDQLQNLIIGAGDSAGSLQRIAATIDQVTVYNQKLSTEEIEALYNNQAGITL